MEKKWTLRGKGLQEKETHDDKKGTSIGKRGVDKRKLLPTSKVGKTRGWHLGRGGGRGKNGGAAVTGGKNL